MGSKVAGGRSLLRAYGRLIHRYNHEESFNRSKGKLYHHRHSEKRQRFTDQLLALADFLDDATAYEADTHAPYLLPR